GKALTQIAVASTAMARAIRSGGRLHYAAAGSSGLMAAADAQELGGTFSIPANQLAIHMAGGLPTGVEMPGDTEDQSADLDAALATLSDNDVLIAVSASGSTPYTLRAVTIAKAQGATVIAIANNRDAPLFEQADHAILLETPPEVLSGSTRMGAATAQKIALNMLSTMMAVELGHIHDGMMVNLHADNIKLRQRAANIVTEIAGVAQEVAQSALEAAQGDVKTAVMVAARDMTPTAAQIALKDTHGRLRDALEHSK
ncbi:MAG: N-acetylmuramic acid 6-phosphate etherase, partial [Rhodobacteraceae bacterium]|nr:N-acetylmuramic acid 6-phosphate etherase [Paracoccaceae bacterium]